MWYIKICAWCGKEISREEVEGEKDIISHGICAECYEKEMTKLGLVLSEEDIANQAKAFLSLWLRTGGSIDEAFEKWAKSKDFSPAERGRIWNAVSMLLPDASKIWERLL